MADHIATLRQANQLFVEGKTAQAEQLLQRALQRSPGDPNLNRTMAHLLLFKGEARRGVYFAERVVKAAPQSADAHMLLANLLGTLNEHEQADASMNRALELDPRQLDARLMQIQRLYGQFKLHEMMERCRDGLRLYPNQPELANNLANALLMMGRGDEAVEVLRAALAANAGNHVLTTGLCAAINYATAATAREVFETHAAYGKVLAAMMLPRPDRPKPVLDPERRLRVGFQSPDLKTHPVAVFLGAFLPHLDRERIEAVGYYTGFVEDEVTRRLKPMFDRWRPFTGLREQDMAQHIIDDRVDILIELDGHFATHRLPSCHLKPAPIVMTYLGYPNTTGVPAIDYRIVDSLTDPAPGTEQLMVERPLRIDPCFLCYRAPDDAPPVDPAPPSQRAGGSGITFGSFNSLQKTNVPLLRVWKRIVEAVPGSRLLIKTNALKHQVLRDELHARFEGVGFPMDRLEIMPPTESIREHLATYDRVDIALDAFPYCGTTTTCEALLMGVPVVSRVSPAQPEGMHAGRVGLSLLTNAGVPELAADGEEAYVQTAVELAGDPARLAALRGSLRERLLASPVCDAAAFAKRFEAALRGVWREFCASGGRERLGERAG